MSFLSCCGNAFTRSACSVEIPMSGAPHTPTGLRSRAPLTPTTPSSPSSKPPLAPMECKWTIWGEPSITLAHVHAVAFYMHPPDTPVHPGWVAKLSAIMAQNKSFHEKEFPGSLMTWSLHGPIKLHRGVPYTLEGEIASNCAYDLCRTTVEALGRTAGALPPPMAHDAPWLPGGVSSSSSSPSSSSTALALPTFPTVLVHPVFLDYGCEDVTGEEGQKKLHKYYVWKAASGLAEAAGIDTGAYLTSMGVTRAGGSRASYSGARAVESFPGIWASLGLLPAAGSGGGGGGRVATINGPLEHVKHTPSLAPISWGVGVVTQEAWVAPDVPGSSIVAWHEGLGHSLNLPHPSYRDDTCVMSHAQYAGIPLQTACVCEELKGGMENPLCVGAGAGAGTQATEVISLPGVGKISTLQVKNGAVKVRTVSLTRPSGGGGGGGGALGVKEVAQGALALFAALECGKGGGGGGGGDLGKRGVSLGWVFDFEGGGETSSTSATAAATSTPLPQKVTLLRRVEGLHPTPNSLCLSSKEPMVPPFPPTLPKPQSTTTFAAGVGEVTLSIPPTPHPSSPSSATAQGTFPLSLFGPRAGSDERASAIESLRLLCNDIVTAAVAESDSAIRRKMMSSSSSSIQDGEVVLDEGGAWVETVLTLMPSSSGGVSESGEVVCCTYSASDAYHFKEVWSGFVVGEGGSIPTSLGAFASHFSPSSLSSWWVPSGVEVWANAHPALFPSIYIPSLGGDSEGLSPPYSGGGGGAAAAPVTPQKAARTLIWEEDERTSSTRLHLLLNDKSRDITLALPLLSSSSSLISSSGPLGRDGYRPFVKGGYVAVW